MGESKKRSAEALLRDMLRQNELDGIARLFLRMTVVQNRDGKIAGGTRGITVERGDINRAACRARIGDICIIVAAAFAVYGSGIGEGIHDFISVQRTVRDLIPA